MSKEVWENLISLNAFGDYDFDALESAASYRDEDKSGIDWATECSNIDGPVDCAIETT